MNLDPVAQPATASADGLLSAADKLAVNALRSPRVFAVDATGTDTARGTALLAQHTAAKAASPTAASPCIVSVAPGVYDLGTSQLVQDTAYVHIISTHGSAYTTLKTSGGGGAGNVLVPITADNTTLQGFTVDYGLTGAGGYSALWSESASHPGTVIRDIAWATLTSGAPFLAKGDGTTLVLAGTYEDFNFNGVAVDGIFNDVASGLVTVTISGTLRNCVFDGGANDFIADGSHVRYDVTADAVMDNVGGGGLNSFVVGLYTGTASTMAGTLKNSTMDSAPTGQGGEFCWLAGNDWTGDIDACDLTLHSTVGMAISGASVTDSTFTNTTTGPVTLKSGTTARRCTFSAPVILKSGSIVEDCTFNGGVKLEAGAKAFRCTGYGDWTNNDSDGTVYVGQCVLKSLTLTSGSHTLTNGLASPNNSTGLA